MVVVFSSVVVWSGVLHVELEWLCLVTVALQGDVHEAGVGPHGSFQQNLGSVAEPWKHTNRWFHCDFSRLPYNWLR